MAVSMVMIVLVNHVFGDMEPLENLRKVTSPLLPMWHLPQNFAHSPSKLRIPEASPCAHVLHRPPSSGHPLLKAWLCSPPRPFRGSCGKCQHPRSQDNRSLHFNTEKDMSEVCKLLFHEQSPFLPPLNKSRCGAPYVKGRKERLLL